MVRVQPEEPNIMTNEKQKHFYTQPPTRRIFIIAGSYQHACFCADHLLKIGRLQWNYIASVEQLYGLRDVDIWLYETWLDKWHGEELDLMIVHLNLLKHVCPTNHINEYGQTFPIC